MQNAKVIVELSCHDSRVSELILAVRKVTDELADKWRCSSMSFTGTERCEQDTNHGGERHTNGTFSWPVTDRGILVNTPVTHNLTDHRYYVDRVRDETVFLRWPSGAGAGGWNRSEFWNNFSAVPE